MMEKCDKSKKIWGKNRVGFAFEKKKNKEEEEECACMCVVQGSIFFYMVPLKRYVVTALAVGPLFTFFFNKKILQKINKARK